jgi:MFS transporter, FSR family, fosmidomycin resistance protein
MVQKMLSNEKIMSGTPEKQDSPATSFQAFKVLTIAFSHLAHDTYIAFVAPLLPVLIENFSLSKTAAGVLSIFTQLPSIVQPVIGRLADRYNLRWVVILAPTLTAAAITLGAVSPVYAILALCFLVAGISNAAFHAVGPVMAGHLSGNKLGRGMSFWMVGGELGRVLGPIIIVYAIGMLTFKGLPWLMIGGFLGSVILYFRLKDATSLAPQTGETSTLPAAFQQLKPLLLPIAALTTVRGFMTAVTTTFLPTFLTENGSNLQFAGVALSILEIAGVAGALLSGPISDRIGRRIIIWIALAASAVFMVIFLWVQGWMIFPILLALGFASISITPVIMAVVQESCQENRALANGMYMALSFVIRAAITVIVGIIGDAYGLRLAFAISAGVILIGIPFVFLLPEKRHLNK